MTIRTTALADEHILAIDDWWREHRLASPDLFSDELADTFAVVASAPQLGRPWTSTDVPGVRRVLMRATRYHVYYRIDGDDVTVLAVWSAVRGRGPRL
jgi:plasmid stabilization system protein ParE